MKVSPAKALKHKAGLYPELPFAQPAVRHATPRDGVWTSESDQTSTVAFGWGPGSYRTGRADRTDRADRADRAGRADRPDRTFVWVMDGSAPHFLLLIFLFFKLLFLLLLRNKVRVQVYAYVCRACGAGSGDGHRHSWPLLPVAAAGACCNMKNSITSANSDQ